MGLRRGVSTSWGGAQSASRDGAHQPVRVSLSESVQHRALGDQRCALQAGGGRIGSIPSGPADHRDSCGPYLAAPGSAESAESARIMGRAEIQPNRRKSDSRRMTRKRPGNPGPQLCSPAHPDATVRETLKVLPDKMFETYIRVEQVSAAQREANERGALGTGRRCHRWRSSPASYALRVLLALLFCAHVHHRACVSMRTWDRKENLDP